MKWENRIVDALSILYLEFLFSLEYFRGVHALFINENSLSKNQIKSVVIFSENLRL